MITHDQYRKIPAADLPDDALLFDRRQIKISIECGVTADYRGQLYERLVEINAELARRQELVDSATMRAELARLNASQLQRLWALISAGVESKVDVMATDEHYKKALNKARELIDPGRDDVSFEHEHVIMLAQALVGMEDDLAQARGFLVAMTRAAEKWRAIARGEK